MEDQAPMPCWHMRRWLPTLVEADGGRDSLRGIAGWYARLHLRGCPRCQAALAALGALHARLRALARSTAAQSPDLPAERHAALNAALDRIDRGEA